VGSSPTRRATFADVFALREFRALWASQILSVGGDRLALVALTLLIYDRTRSPLLAAVAYAAGYVPYVLGALFLSGLADRLPRREVMVACDVIRAVLVGVRRLRGPDADPATTGDRRLHGDLRGVGCVRDLPDRGEYRVRRAGAQRATGSGVRASQRRLDCRSGGGVPSGRSGRRGGTALDGSRARWRTGRHRGHRPGTSLAAHVAGGRAPLREASWRRSQAPQAGS
jgi:hypothetical protein